MRWLLVGALPSETLPVIRRLVSVRPRGPRLAEGLLTCGDEAHRVWVLTCGPGPDRARRRTREVLALGPVEAVLNLGTCGALRDDLRVGDVLCGASATDERGRSWPLTPLAGLPLVPIATVREVVSTVDRRDALQRAGHAICEMEAAAVAEAAGGLPVAALKVVSDLAGADPAGAPLAPSPWRMLRFHAHAMALSETRLLPALRAVLSRGG